MTTTEIRRGISYRGDRFNQTSGAHEVVVHTATTPGTRGETLLTKARASGRVSRCPRSRERRDYNIVILSLLRLNVAHNAFDRFIEF